jgi:hypothetical protein
LILLLAPSDSPTSSRPEGAVDPRKSKSPAVTRGFFVWDASEFQNRGAIGSARTFLGELTELASVAGFFKRALFAPGP